MANQMANSLLIDGYLYGINGNDDQSNRAELVCMNFATGKVAWRHRGTGCGSLIAAGKNLIIQAERGELITARVDSKEFHQISSAQVFGSRSWTTPAISNGMIYSRNDIGGPCGH